MSSQKRYFSSFGSNNEGLESLLGFTAILLTQGLFTLALLSEDQSTLISGHVIAQFLVWCGAAAALERCCSHIGEYVCLTAAFWDVFCVKKKL